MDKKTEALKLALKKAFDLGKRYWQQADSDFISQWRKADVTLASFNQLVEDTIREALAEHPDHHHEPIKWSSHEPDGTRHNKPAQTQHGNIIKVRVWHDDSHDHNAEFSGYGNLPDGEHIFYTSPPASKPWVGLTYGEREKLRSEADEDDAGYMGVIVKTEAKLREKNAAPRKPLTDEQWQSIADTLGCIITRGQKDIIEAVLCIKEKNT